MKSFRFSDFSEVGLNFILHVTIIYTYNFLELFPLQPFHYHSEHLLLTGLQIVY